MTQEMVSLLGTQTILSQNQILLFHKWGWKFAYRQVLFLNLYTIGSILMSTTTPEFLRVNLKYRNDAFKLTTLVYLCLKTPTRLYFNFHILMRLEL